VERASKIKDEDREVFNDDFDADILVARLCLPM